MTKEQQPQSGSGFDLSENERLFDRVSHKRFEQLIFNQQTTIHQIKLDSNSYGEFLFVMASRPQEQGREVLSFWGHGYHEYRERWLIDEWFYHSSTPSKTVLQTKIVHDEARKLIQTRREEIEADAVNSEQSQMGALFEILADMADDDGALAELEDLGWTLFDDK